MCETLFMTLLSSTHATSLNVSLGCSSNRQFFVVAPPAPTFYTQNFAPHPCLPVGDVSNNVIMDVSYQSPGHTSRRFKSGGYEKSTPERLANAKAFLADLASIDLPRPIPSEVIR